MVGDGTRREGGGSRGKAGSGADRRALPSSSHELGSGCARYYVRPPLLCALARLEKAGAHAPPPAANPALSPDMASLPPAAAASAPCRASEKAGAARPAGSPSRGAKLEGQWREAGGLATWQDVGLLLLRGMPAS